MGSTATKQTKQSMADYIRCSPNASVDALIENGRRDGYKLTRDRINTVRRLDKLGSEKPKEKFAKVIQLHPGKKPPKVKAPRRTKKKSSKPTRKAKTKRAKRSATKDLKAQHAAIKAAATKRAKKRAAQTPRQPASSPAERQLANAVVELGFAESLSIIYNLRENLKKEWL
jgi:hypothetical protein